MQLFERHTHPALRVVIALGLVATLLLFAAGELLAGHCEEECADECDDSCDTCGDCINCMPTLHLYTVDDFDHDVGDFDSARAEFPKTHDREGLFGEGIDRPPQNIV